MNTTNERIFANDIKMSYWQQDNCMRCAKAVWYNTQLGRCPKYKCALQRDMEAQAAGGHGNQRKVIQRVPQRQNLPFHQAKGTGSRAGR